MFKRPELAGQWFIIPYTYDRERAPSEWAWGDMDIEANSLLSRQLKLSTKPARRWVWPHSGTRPSANVADTYIPACFPDDSRELPAVLARATAISGMYGNILDFLRSVTPMALPVRDAARIPALSDGDCYFAPFQYQAYLGWLVKNDTAYPTDADGRQERFEAHAGAPFSWDEEWAASVVATGKDVYVLPSAVAREVGRVLYGPLVNSR